MRNQKGQIFIEYLLLLVVVVVVATAISTMLVRSGGQGSGMLISGWSNIVQAIAGDDPNN